LEGSTDTDIISNPLSIQMGGRYGFLGVPAIVLCWRMWKWGVQGCRNLIPLPINKMGEGRGLSHLSAPLIHLKGGMYVYGRPSVGLIIYIPRFFYLFVSFEISLPP
jgi:hypothetical protein